MPIVKSQFIVSNSQVGISKKSDKECSAVISPLN